MLTPEQIQQMQQEPTEQPPVQQPVQQPQQPEQLPPEAIEEAKKMLGLDNVEQKIAEIEAQREEAKRKAIRAELAGKYKEVPGEAIDKELEKIKEKDPTLYETITGSEEGMEMLYARAQANMEPQEKPDDITDSSDQQSPEDDALKRIKEGKSSGEKFFMDLGTLITGG